jgi:hypothetical protein
VHSHWSAGYDRRQAPPTPIKGREGLYPIPQNARMAARYGLSWMVTTDHGGPYHSKLNADEAYPELRESRALVPDLLQFYGMELNMPGMDHHTLIVPYAEDERSVLFEIESRFDSSEAWPRDPSRNSERGAVAAVEHMRQLPRLPLVFANHPARSAKGVRQYGLDEPREFRNVNDAAPDVYRGMEGGPGHQAGTLARGGSTRQDESGRPVGARGAYRNPGAHTFGGFDQMTAIVGGVWDSLLGEGRRFWIVATSDSHVHYTESPRAGSDFWPGEFHKTYVYARKTYEDVLDGLRAGRIFAVAGDLVTELDVAASAGDRIARVGATLRVGRGDSVGVTIAFRDPATPNNRGDDPGVGRVDLIVGEVHGPVFDRNADRNDTARVLMRFGPAAWTQAGDRREIEAMLPPIDRSVYIRIRGTNSPDAEPRMDEPGEDPWSDLWFYSNPIFIELDELDPSSSSVHLPLR